MATENYVCIPRLQGVHGRDARATQWIEISSDYRAARKRMVVLRDGCVRFGDNFYLCALCVLCG